MANLITIDDSNFQQHLDHIGPDGDKRAKGLRPRNFGTHPVGYLGTVAAPLTIPLIPESEWDERIAEQEAKQSSLQHIRDKGNNGQPISSYDQDGKGYCATADTEVLTDKGWVPYPEYDWITPLGTVNRLTHALEFQRPFERHIYEYDGPMIYSTNRRIDFGVTPDHLMYVRKWNEAQRTLASSYSLVRAGNMGWYAGLLAAPCGQIGTELVEIEVPGDRRYDGDDFLALLALVVSDGYAGSSDSTRNWVSFASFREALRPAVSALAARIGFREKPSCPGVWVRYDAGALAAWLRENCYVDKRTGARAKRVPVLVKCTSQRQIKHFLCWFGDRSYDGQVAFWSTSARLIDDLQELHLRIGKRATIRDRNAKQSILKNGKTITSGPGFVLTVSETDRLCIDRKKHIEMDRYKGLVYCAAVPNHTLVTRRNGSVLISSNCWAHSSTSAVTLVRALNNQPFVPLSAYAVACIIKNYRDEGGWGAESLTWISQNGIPSSQFWPMQSMSPSNDNPAMRANAKQHVCESWWDLSDNRSTAKQQLATLLLLNVPVVVDYNWWSHSVCAVRLVKASPFTVRIWNSWGDSWSQNGMGDLVDSKAIPDGAVAPRVMTAADV